MGIKIMKQLNKHKLDFDLTIKYVKNNLENVNSLSSELLRSVEFKDGFFFTLLPNDANIKRIYEFESGIILSQNPEKKYFISEKQATYSIIPSIREEISELIFKEMKSKCGLYCIFDDVIRSRKDKHHMDLFYECGLSYKDEVYYLLKKDGISVDTITRCLRTSNAFWHSLCVLTSIDFKYQNKCEIDLEVIRNTCLNSEIIILGAYDGEGYIFWEKVVHRKN